MEEVDAPSDVPPRALNRRVSIHVAELPQAETVVILRGGLREAVHEDVWRLGMKFLLMSNANISNTSKCFRHTYFTDSPIQLEVLDRAPRCSGLKILHGRGG